MTARVSQHQIERLSAAVAELREGALALERAFESELAEIAADYRDGARNLLHYLSVRQHDIRALQDELSSLGLSSLGRMEAHTLASLEAVLETLNHLVEGAVVAPFEPKAPVNFRMGHVLLGDHANRLLGRAPSRRSVRIMVTMPSEAAREPELVRHLLQAGMNVMRINCAHDSPEDWLAMLAHLRHAEAALQQRCRVLADLGGPKLRTGAIADAERVLKFKPRRDVRGGVLAAARLWLTPAPAPEPAPEQVNASLHIEGGVLDAACGGERLAVEDCRGKFRQLRLLERRGASWFAESAQTTYLAEGARIRLERDGNAVAQGVVSCIPDATPALTVFAGDRLSVVREREAEGAAGDDEPIRGAAPPRVPCTLGAAFEAVKAGEHIWFDDGKIGGIIADAGRDHFTVEITHARPKGSKLRADKGINLPDSSFDLPALTSKDIRDLEIMTPHVDLVGLSFVRRPEDILDLEQRLHALGAGHLGIVLKIETRRAFECLPRLLLTGLRSPPVGIMVARGDLAVEVGFERLAEIQEEILWMCEASHVPVIWATQVLEGLAKKGAPSRAEVTDAAMSGRAECVMLNKGPYVVDAVDFLSGVLERMQAHQNKKSAMLRRLSVSDLAP